MLKESESTGDGKMQTLVIDYSPPLEAIHEKGWKMIEKGQVEEALQLWEKAYIHTGKIYPPALPDIIQLYVQDGKYAEAEFYLTVLEQINEVESGEWRIHILISRVLLNYHQGDTESAMKYIAELEEIELDPDDRVLLEQLKASLQDNTGDDYMHLLAEVMMDEVFELAAQELREEVENKELPVDPAILRGMKNLPVEWIDGMCKRLGQEILPKRKDREKLISAYLQEPINLQDLCEEYLDDEEKALLVHLLKKEGWGRVNILSRKFGGLDGESYFWPEEGTCTVMGSLWSVGLVMVGRAEIKGRKSKIVTIPKELREPLRGILLE